MNRQTSAAALILTVILVMGCGSAAAQPQTVHRAYEGPLRPVAVSEPTFAPTEAPRATWTPTASPAPRSNPEPAAKAAPKATPRVRPATPNLGGRVVSGAASYMGSAFPASYLALPRGSGVMVRICGAGGCVTMRSTDAGPDRAMQRLGRVADLSNGTWLHVCGLPLSAGLCQISVTYP